MPGAVRIVGDDYLRLIAVDEVPDPAGGVLDGHAAESVAPGLQTPLRDAGVVVVEQFEVRDVEVFAGAA
ncbi:MAG: hypothetical protein WCC38_01550 [Pseudonocardiaceae bacterium]